MSPRENDLPILKRRREKRVETVRFLRRALPAVAAALLLACAAQIAIRTLSSAPPSIGRSEALKMLSPRFSGKSRDGRSFVITGAEGMADEKDDKLILLAEPVLKMRSPGKRTTTMTARSGVYDELASKLLLKGEVRVDNGSGARFSSQQAVIDTHTGEVSGQSGLRAESSAGKVQSQDYRVLDEGDRLIFKGGVHGQLTPHK